MLYRLQNDESELMFAVIIEKNFHKNADLAIKLRDKVSPTENKVR